MKETKSIAYQPELPVGTIIAIYSRQIPHGWLLCDGEEIDAKYQSLITLIGRCTPNLGGKVLIGAGISESGTEYSIGDTGGQEKYALTKGEMPPHVHQVSTINLGRGGRGWADSNEDGSYYTSMAAPLDKETTESNFRTDNTGGEVGADNERITTPHQNMQPYFTVNYIIYTGG